MKQLDLQIEDALSKYEYYLNQGMTVLAMEYLNFASGLMSIKMKKGLV